MNKKKPTIILLIATILFFSLFFSNLVANFQNLDLGEPEFGAYRSDEMIFLKTFYLMKKGQIYYQAFKQANEGDVRGKKMAGDVFTWRLPTAFYLWKVAANDGKQILRNFWILVFLSLVASFFLLKKFLNLWFALLGPILLIPYFVDTLFYKTSFLFTEWWSWFFFIFGLTFFVYNKKCSAWILLLLAVITRELMIIPIVAFLILSFFWKKNRLFFFSICLGFILFFFVHCQVVSSQFSPTWPGAFGHLGGVLRLISQRLHSFKKLAFLKMVSFSMRQYPLVKYKSHFFLLALAFVSLVVNFLKKKMRKGVGYLFVAGWSLLLSLPFIFSSQYNDYWGILFMPTLILSIPLIFYSVFGSPPGWRFLEAKETLLKRETSRLISIPLFFSPRGWKRRWKQILPIFIILFVSAILLTRDLNKKFIGYHDWNSVVYGRSAKSLIGKSELPGVYLQSHYPPLLPLFLGGSFLIFGVKEWAARIVPVLTMTGTAIVLYYLGKKLWSIKEGLTASLFFLFTPLIRYFAKIPVHETVLPLFIVLAFYFYWLWHKSEKRRYYFLLLLTLVLAEFTGWPGYYPVIWLSLHYLIYVKKKNYWLVINWWLISFLMFTLFLFVNSFFADSNFLVGLWHIFKFRANLGGNQMPFSWQEFITKELLWMRVYFTRILSFLVILWGVITPLDIFKKKKISSKTAFLIFLFLSGFIHLLFFILVWFHDYMIIYLAPFVVLVSARMIILISQKISLKYYLLTSLVLLTMFLESYNFLTALNKTHDFYPAYLLGEEIRHISKPEEQFFVSSLEGGKMYGVYLDYYADRIHDLGEPTLEEFVKKEQFYKENFRYFVIDTGHNYLESKLIEYLLDNYQWHKKGQFQIVDLHSI